MRCLARAGEYIPARDPSGGRTYSWPVGTRGSFLASGAGGTGGSDFTGTSSGASLTTGTFAAFFASGAGRARGSSISLGREKRGCQVPVDSGAPRRPQRGPAPSPPLCPLPPPPPANPQSVGVFTTVLTEGPGGPTRPAAPGKPVAPWQRKTESSEGEHPHPCPRLAWPPLPPAHRSAGAPAEKQSEVLTGGPALPRAPLGPGAPTLPWRTAQSH